MTDSDKLILETCEALIELLRYDLPKKSVSARNLIRTEMLKLQNDRNKNQRLGKNVSVMDGGTHA